MNRSLRRMPRLNCPECFRPLIRSFERDGYVCPKLYARRRPDPDNEACYIEVGFPSPCERVFVSAYTLHGTYVEVR